MIALSSNSRQGKCIFCGGFGLTKQHVWPEWIQNVLPRDVKKHTQLIMRHSIIQKDNMIIQPEFVFKQGHPGSRKIRNVCCSCNTGWMSRLEEKAKPYLAALMKNEEIILDTDIQRIISSWIVMTSIMGEFTDIKTVSIPTLHRSMLMETEYPPEGWKIWIGWYRGLEWEQRYRHYGCASVSREQLGKVQPEFNTQHSTFVFGELLIHAISTTLPGYNINFTGMIERKLRCIWPIKEEYINWPPRTALTDEDAMNISDTFLHTGALNIK